MLSAHSHLRALKKEHLRVDKLQMSDTEPSTETTVPTVTPGPCVEKVRETVPVHLKIHDEGTEASSILFVS